MTEKCAWCGREFKALARHETSCPSKKEYTKLLESEGIAGNPVTGEEEISGGAKVYVFLRDQPSKRYKRKGSEADERIERNVQAWEKKHGVRLYYDPNTDELKAIPAERGNDE